MVSEGLGWRTLQASVSILTDRKLASGAALLPLALKGNTGLKSCALLQSLVESFSRFTSDCTDGWDWSRGVLLLSPRSDVQVYWDTMESTCTSLRQSKIPAAAKTAKVPFSWVGALPFRNPVAGVSSGKIWQLILQLYLNTHSICCKHSAALCALINTLFFEGISGHRKLQRVLRLWILTMSTRLQKKKYRQEMIDCSAQSNVPAAPYLEYLTQHQSKEIQMIAHSS